jgi:1-deoxy-D-xylulose-5-phosphate synthase
MMEEMPERAIDVGIAEQHAVTLAAGMATQGMTVFCTIYSTFLQRAYDQVIHDVALQDLPVIFCLDRAGLVGEDGATHHGVFDISYLRCVPNMIVYSPLNEKELRNMLFTSSLGLAHPIAIRYPRGRGVVVDWRQSFEKIEIGKARQLRKGSSVAVLSNGFIGNNVISALENVGNASKFSHFDFAFAKPLDERVLHSIFTSYEAVITVEDGVLSGGFGSAVSEFASENDYRISVKSLGIPDRFIEHGSISHLQQIVGLDVKNLEIIFGNY